MEIKPLLGFKQCSRSRPTKEQPGIWVLTADGETKSRNAKIQEIPEKTNLLMPTSVIESEGNYVSLCLHIYKLQLIFYAILLLSIEIMIITLYNSNILLTKLKRPFY